MDNKTINPNNIYFANKQPDQLAANLLEKGDSFFNFLRSNAYLTKLIDNWRVYHGAFNSDVSYGHQITFTGEQGELVQLPVNHYRNLAQHMLNMITSIRPVMEPRAINSDYKSLAQTYLAKGILDYYMRDKKLEDYLRVACEMAIVMGSGYVRMEWNPTMGEEYDYDPETDKTMYTGDLEFSNLSPFDVIFDGTKDSFESQDWLLIRTYKNKYDLAAKYPELSEKILSIPSKYEQYPYRLSIWSNDDTDDVPVYEFYHKKTEAVKDGRYLLFLSPEVVLLDTPMPYRVIPVFRMAPSNILGTPYGYTPMFDIYPLQEGINSLYSAIMTNANAFAVQNVFVKTGTNLQISQIDGGLNIMEGTEKPEPINLSGTSEETFAFLKILEQTAETISGINSVARGNPESSLKSGAALALVQSMAIQFISGLQNSYVKMIEHTGTALIQNLKDFAKTPRVAAIVGKAKRAELKEFTGDDLVAINRVVVDVGNPLARTISGRVQMAEQMMQMGLIKNPQEYFQVINTGSLDTMFEGDMRELLLIKQENEQMMNGETPIVSPFDQHRLHFNEHRAVLSDPDLRKDPELVKITMDHMQIHIDYLRQTDPGILSLINEQPLPPASGLQPEGGVAPQQMPDQGGSAAQVMGTPEALPRPGEQINGAQLPNLPKPPQPFQNLPINPAQNIPS